jgi:autotransporter passenger strand-loop-strand repeat protein
MTTVGSGQSQTILQDQADSGDLVLSGGTETVAPGGVSTEPILNGGLLFDGGFVTRAQVNAGGALFDSGFANHTTVTFGAIVHVESPGRARASVIDSGGTVYDGGTVNRTMVNTGGVLYVGGPVTVSGVTSDFVGSANRTVLNGGTEYLLSGTDTRTWIGSGGLEYVGSGGTAIGTTIHRGGELIVSSGGVAHATRVDSGGLELVESGGIANGARINGSGTLEFAASDTGITQDVRFGNVGSGIATLKFDATATTNAGLIYDGVISGFNSPNDEIDLAGLGFVSGQTSATSVLSGSNTILTFTNGTQTVALTLAGNHTSDSFAVASDGSGGTTVVDPSASWSDWPLGWLESHVPSVVSDLGWLRSDNGFSQLLNQIESWNSPFGSGSTPTGDTSNDPWVQPNFPVSGFDAGWQSHMIQTLASFEDSKGGPSQASPIQPINQGPDGFFAGATPRHG